MKYNGRELRDQTEDELAALYAEANKGIEQAVRHYELMLAAKCEIAAERARRESAKLN